MSIFDSMATRPRHVRKPRRRAGLGTSIQVRVSSEHKAKFEEAATRRGLGVSAWMRTIALEAVERDGAAAVRGQS